MKRTYTKTRCLALGVGVAMLASSMLFPTPLIAYDYSFSSNTILQMRTSIDKKDFFPAYEYFRLNVIDNRNDGSGVAFNLGAWGRVDLADKSTDSNTNGDIQYAFLTYRAPKNNTAVSVGRQFISEGVATERVDGIYLRNDFAYGIGAAAFFGDSVITEPTFKGGEIIYGGRITQTDKKFYTIGVSALKSDREDDSRYREEGGIDIWLRPHQQVDLTGRSTYNSVTDGWMENSYAATWSPLPTLRLGADFSYINFKDYLYGVTTSALSTINPGWSSNEEQTAVGANVGFTAIKNLSVSADYKFYSYDKDGEASFFGGNASYILPEALLVGGSIHRMRGEVEKLRYMEFRAFATKKLGNADLTVDAININYDEGINGIRNSYAITGAAGYEFNRNLRVRGDVEYLRNPDFDNEVRALVLATYTFDSKPAAERGKKSEK